MNKLINVFFIIIVNQIVAINFEFLTNKHVENEINVHMFQYFDKYDNDFCSTWDKRLDIQTRRERLSNDFFSYCYNDNEEVGTIYKIVMDNRYKVIPRYFINGVISQISKNDIGVLLLRSLITFYRKHTRKGNYYFYKGDKVNFFKISFIFCNKDDPCLNVYKESNNCYPILFFPQVLDNFMGRRINYCGDIKFIVNSDRIIFHELNHLLYYLFSMTNNKQYPNNLYNNDLNAEIFDIEKVKYYDNAIFHKFFIYKGLAVQFSGMDMRCIFGLFKEEGEYFFDIINETLYDFFDDKKMMRCNYEYDADKIDASKCFVIPDMFYLYDSIDTLKKKIEEIYIIGDSFWDNLYYYYYKVRNMIMC